MSQKDEAADPVNSHVAAALALFREGFQTPRHLEGALAEGDPERTLPEAPVWLSYVENGALRDRCEAF